MNPPFFTKLGSKKVSSTASGAGAADVPAVVGEIAVDNANGSPTVYCTVTACERPSRLVAVTLKL
jgi:hypothetical protein